MTRNSFRNIPSNLFRTLHIIVTQILISILFLFLLLLLPDITLIANLLLQLQNLFIQQHQNIPHLLLLYLKIINLFITFLLPFSQYYSIFSQSVLSQLHAYIRQIQKIIYTRPIVIIILQTPIDNSKIINNKYLYISGEYL